MSRLAIFLLIAGPVEAVFGVLLWSRPRMLSRMPELDSVIGAAVIGGGLLVAGLILAGTLPRLLTPLLRPGKTYPLFGIHFTVQRLVSRWSNLAPFNLLFGDSVLITRYLKLIGYRLGRVEQTGSNSDGLSMMNADFSSSAFQVRPVVVGPGNFLGNDLAFPAGARTGENCLIATKAMIPLAGPVREGVGLLGSPCFEIPRTVQRATRFDELSAEPERRRRIIAKTRHNLVTIALHLLVRFALLCWLLVVALLPVSDRGWQGWASTTGLIFADLAVLTSVGGGTTLNMACLLQGHSLEDGIFTSDRISIGSGCTVGTGAFVHYAVTMEDGALVEADSFAMKGSVIRRGARWLGNPATEGETTWGSSSNVSLKSAATAENGQPSSTGRREAGSTTSTAGRTWTSSPGPAR